jgi:hypothetical protein
MTQLCFPRASKPTSNLYCVFARSTAHPQRCLSLAQEVFADISVGDEVIRKAHERKCVLPFACLHAMSPRAQNSVPSFSGLDTDQSCRMILPLVFLSSSSSSLHFQLRPASGLHENTSQAALEHKQATITHVGPANHHPPHTCTCAQTEPPSDCHDDSSRHGCQ